MSSVWFFTVHACVRLFVCLRKRMKGEISTRREVGGGGG